jgi:hypothetical protein
MTTNFNMMRSQRKRSPRVPGRGKGKIWIGPDFEFTDEEIAELFEASLERPVTPTDDNVIPNP